MSLSMRRANCAPPSPSPPATKQRSNEKLPGDGTRPMPWRQKLGKKPEAERVVHNDAPVTSQNTSIIFESLPVSKILTKVSAQKSPSHNSG